MHAYDPSIMEEKVRIICEAKKAGKSDIVAASEAHVPPRTMFSWIIKGVAGQEPYASFARRYRDAIDFHANSRPAALRLEYEKRQNAKKEAIAYG
jgi:hypothetical protein